MIILEERRSNDKMVPQKFSRMWKWIIIACFVVDKSPVITLDCCVSCRHDCQDHRDLGHITSGVYHVIPLGMRNGYDAYCDMTTDGGGWMVFQRRLDGSLDFYRHWKDYERGFGNVSHEYWLGLYPLYRLVSKGPYELRIDMEDWDGGKAYAYYNEFTIADASENFRLTVGMYDGNAGDSLERSNGHMFTTKDRDNDVHTVVNCGSLFTAGWWYEGCCDSNLNGLYGKKVSGDAFENGIFWHHWKDNFYSLKSVEMKIRRL